MALGRTQVGQPLRRLTHGLRLLTLSGVLTAAGCGSSPVSPSPASPASPPDRVTPPMQPARVAIISIDGLRPDAILTAGAANILALAGRGAYSWRAQTILPSTTLPAHVSMLSGFTPDAHRILWDDYIPERGPIPVPTIFGVAHSQGRRTAMIAGKHKFTYFCDLGTCDVWSISGNGDDELTARAMREGSADLLFVHLPDVDLTGHASGWMSGPYLAAVRRADVAVGRIISALPLDTTVILSADHGGHLAQHGSSDALDMTIPWIVAGPGVASGRQLSSSIRTVDTAATAAYVLGVPLQPGVAGRPVLEAFVAQ